MYVFGKELVCSTNNRANTDLLLLFFSATLAMFVQLLAYILLLLSIVNFIIIWYKSKIPLDLLRFPDNLIVLSCFVRTQQVF